MGTGSLGPGIRACVLRSLTLATSPHTPARSSVPWLVFLLTCPPPHGVRSLHSLPPYGGCQVNGPKVAKFLDR